jgi:hypothetical protein
MRHDGSGAPTQPRELRDALLGALCVAVAFALTLAVQQRATRAYFILFVPAVMFATWFGGRASGLVASGLSVLAAVLIVPREEIFKQSA